MENKIKHLEIIQGVINRMASNSFALKGWAVTLVAGLFALSSKDTDKMYFLIAYMPILVFWALDSYYLYQERLFRSLYNDIREFEETDIDFNMNVCKYKSKNNYFNCIKSVTELWFYIPLAFMVTLLIILTHLL